MKDRTQEFFAAVESIEARQQGASAMMVALNAPGQQQRLLIPTNKTEFAKAASQISKELTITMLKLQKLATLAKNKSLFDDRPLEINELVFVIKQDIAKINRQISTLSDYLNQGKQNLGNKQIEEHSKNVISNLQYKLANTSKEFQSVLQVRTQNLKDQKVRRDEYSYAPQLSAATPPSNNDSALYNPTSTSSQQLRQRNTGSEPTETVIDFGVQDTSGFGFGDAQQNMALMQNNVNMEIVESRASAIESIESTIAELGQIYTHFAQILNQQRESIQRIDDNVMDTEANVMGAHTELLRYYQSISGNRWFMIKIFSVIIFFFLMYTVFFS